jgi:ADYC domain-containing protein
LDAAARRHVRCVILAHPPGGAAQMPRCWAGFDPKEHAMRAVITLGLGVGLAMSAGCAMEPVTLAEATSAFTECDVTRCGTNSPSIDGRGFHDLNLSGLENAQRIRLVAFVKAGNHYQPRVVHGRLMANGGSGPLVGTALVGAQFIVAEETGRQFAITIESVGAVHYWAALPGVPLATLETYNLDWQPVGVEQRQPLCGNPPLTQDPNDLLGMTVLTAVMFEGDRIDADAKTVSGTIDPSWFNIGCAGHAIAKLALTGHTEAARFDGYATSTQDRQAMLKMLTGDYCGRGEAFTAPGERLFWRDDRHWMNYLGPVRTPVEARWTPVGAACLGAARLDINPPLVWPSTLPKPVTPAINLACPALPPCADLDPFNQDGFHLVSANPM